MKKAQKFVVGLAAGAGVAMALTRLSRARLGISFEDRVVVITGGSRGLGLVMARLFAAEGARVVLLARDLGELDRARRDLEDRGGRVLTLRCDIRRRADVRAAIDRIVEEYRAIDVLVNNAGVIQVGPLEHMLEEDFENASATHFRGPLNLILEVVPIMRHRSFGRIVNIASVGGRIAVPHLAPYYRQQVRAHRPVGCDTRGAGRVRHPRDHRGTGTDADRLAPTRDVQGTACRRVHAVQDGQLDPGPHDFGGPRRAKDCRGLPLRGSSLTITPQAKLAAAMNAAVPGATARAMMLLSRLLPRPNGVDGNVSLKGREVDRHGPSLVGALTDRAAVANNEI